MHMCFLIISVLLQEQFYTNKVLLSQGLAAIVPFYMIVAKFTHTISLTSVGIFLRQGIK